MAPPNDEELERRRFLASIMAFAAAGGAACAGATRNVNPSSPKPSPDLTAFVALSKALTGVSSLDDSLASDYLDLLTTHPDFATGTQRLLGTFLQIISEHGDTNSLIQTRIIESDELRPAAQQVIYLWYAGGLYLKNPLDPTNDKKGVWKYDSPKHYERALMWTLLSTHAPMTYGGKYGHWSTPPHKAEDT